MIGDKFFDWLLGIPTKKPHHLGPSIPAQKRAKSGVKQLNDSLVEVSAWTVGTGECVAALAETEEEAKIVAFDKFKEEYGKSPNAWRVTSNVAV